MAYMPFTNADFEELCTLMPENDTEGDVWEFTDGPTKVWRRPDPKNKAIMMMRAQQVVPADQNLDPLDVMSVWRDIDYRFAWDDRCAVNVCHEKIAEGTDEENELGYYEAKAPPPLSNRDFVLQSGWRYRWKGCNTHLIMNKSIEHEAFPEKKGCVRALSFITGTRIACAEDGEVTITYVTSGDVGGWIPKAVTNWILKQAAPGLMKQMVDSSLAYKAWKAQQENVEK